MGIETERKFLFDFSGWVDSINPYIVSIEFITQAYISITDNVVTRVRLSVPDTSEDAAERGLLTIKNKPNEGSFARQEFEYEIPIADARDLLALAAAPISKRRFRVRHPEDGKIWDCDIFTAPGKLAMCEIELSTEDEDFCRWPWLLEEVTFNEQYTNAWISLNGIPA